MFRRGNKPSQSAADDERQALFEQLSERPESVCPFLGLDGARVGYQEQATDQHRCFAFGDPERIASEQQRNVCMQRGYANCPRYLRGVLVIPTDELEALRRPPQRVPPPPPPVAAPAEAADGGRRRWVVVLLLVLLVGVGGAWLMLSGPGPLAEGPTPTPNASDGAATPSPSAAEPNPSASVTPSTTPLPTPTISISGTRSFSLMGAATREGDTLRLTDSNLDQAGAAWYPEAVPVADGFTVEFSYQVGSLQGGGGDGIAFVIQSQGPSAIGASGEQLGYGGLANSIALELDTFPNQWPDGDDPNDNHISLQTGDGGANGGDHRYSLGYATAIPNLSDGEVHRVRVTYVPGTYVVSVDGASVLTVSVDLRARLTFAPGGTAYVGFTAATGSAGQTNNLLSVAISFP